MCVTKANWLGSLVAFEDIVRRAWVGHVYRPGIACTLSCSTQHTSYFTCATTIVWRKSDGTVIRKILLPHTNLPLPSTIKRKIKIYIIYTILHQKGLNSVVAVRFTLENQFVATMWWRLKLALYANIIKCWLTMNGSLIMQLRAWLRPIHDFSDSKSTPFVINKICST